jgi:hypothetical protein
VMDGAWGLAALANLQRVSAAAEVKIQRGAFAKEGERHVKTLGQEPASFGINGRAAWIQV